MFLALYFICCLPCSESRSVALESALGWFDRSKSGLPVDCGLAWKGNVLVQTAANQAMLMVSVAG